MVDANDLEACAKDTAGALGGAYLESIGKTDLAEMTKQEWQAFIDVVCGGYVDAVLDMKAKIGLIVEKIETPEQPF